MYFVSLLSMTLLFPLIVVLIGMERRMRPYGVIVQSVVTLFLSMLLLFAFAKADGAPVAVSIMQDVTIAVNQIVEMDRFMETAGLSGTPKEEVKTLLLTAYEGLVQMLPSGVICWGILISYFYYALLSRLKNTGGGNTPMLPPFMLFSLPPGVLRGSILIYILSWLAVTAGWVGQDMLLLNVRAVLEFLFAIQGLATALFTMRWKRLSGTVTVFVGGVLFITGIGRLFLALLGLFDLLTGLRQKLQNQ